MSLSYQSQYKQDQRILTLLNEKKGGFFLDIGSSDPVSLSNTHVLEKELGWSGLCVDPRKGLVDKFREHRACSFENSAVYTHTGMVSFSDLGAHGGVNDSEVTDKVTLDQTKIYDVSCITFADLFEKHKIPNLIHYMSLDVEGAELLLLENFPFSQKKVLTMSVEHNNHLGDKQRVKATKILELMYIKGFELHLIVACDYIFKHKDLEKYNK